MAKFTLKIECDNAAFDDSPGIEIARILREALVWIEGIQHTESATLHDINGNRVGVWGFKL